MRKYKKTHVSKIDDSEDALALGDIIDLSIRKKWMMKAYLIPITIQIFIICTDAMAQSQNQYSNEIEDVKIIINKCISSDDMQKLEDENISITVGFDSGGVISRISLQERERVRYADPKFRSISQSLIRTAMSCPALKAIRMAKMAKQEIAVEIGAQPKRYFDTKMIASTSSSQNNNAPTIINPSTARDDEVDETFYCLGVISSLHSWASAGIMGLKLRKLTSEPEMTQFETVKNYTDNDKNILFSLLEDYEKFKKFDPRYSFGGKGIYYRCGFEAQQRQEATYVNFRARCAGAVSRLAKQARPNTSAPSLNEAPINVRELCAEQKGLRRFPIVPSGWETARKIDGIPYEFFGSWTVDGLGMCLDYKIYIYNVDKADVRAVYQSGNSILAITGFPPLRQSYLISISPDSVLHQRVIREEPDAWPIADQPAEIDLRDMVRCR